MNTNFYYRSSIDPNFGFNRLSIGNPFNYYTTQNMNNVGVSRYSTLTYNTAPKPQYYNLYLLQENKLGLKTNPRAPPMTNVFNLNTANVRSEQKYNPYYNSNNYPQRMDNIKDLMNYTYSERVPKYSMKNPNPIIGNYPPYAKNNAIQPELQRNNIFNSIPRSSRIPQTQQNIYTYFINNTRFEDNYQTVLDNNPTSNENKVKEINDGFLTTDIQLKNNNNTDIQFIKNNNITKNGLNGKSGSINREIVSDSNSKEFYNESKGGLVKNYGYYEDHGSRDYMEDQGKSVENLNNDPNKILFCLFDGHGGDQISKFLQENFANYMKKMLPLKNKFAINKLFQILDEEIKKLNFPEVGSTATIAYIERKENGRKFLRCMNVGDSRCVLVNRKEVIRMSYDDRVDDPKEQERVKRQKGVIYNGRICGLLMLSRCFGDWAIKEYGITVEPHIYEQELNDDNLFLIMATDGVWDVIKDEELMALTRTNSNSLEIAKNIIVEALHRGSQDNISCFVINL